MFFEDELRLNLRAGRLMCCFLSPKPPERESDENSTATESRILPIHMRTSPRPPYPATSVFHKLLHARKHRSVKPERVGRECSWVTEPRPLLLDGTPLSPHISIRFRSRNRAVSEECPLNPDSHNSTNTTTANLF